MGDVASNEMLDSALRDVGIQAHRTDGDEREFTAGPWVDSPAFTVKAHIDKLDRLVAYTTPCIAFRRESVARLLEACNGWNSAMMFPRMTVDEHAGMLMINSDLIVPSLAEDSAERIAETLAILVETTRQFWASLRAEAGPMGDVLEGFAELLAQEAGSE